MNTMRVNICERCKVLLLQVTTKMIEYHLSELNENGEYEWTDHGEADYDSTLCPICSGTDQDDYDETLNSIELPIELKPKLFKIWESLQKEELNKPPQSKMSTELVITEYGIPLDNKELKELLVEYLV